MSNVPVMGNVTPLLGQIADQQLRIAALEAKIRSLEEDLEWADMLDELRTHPPAKLWPAGNGDPD